MPTRRRDPFDHQYKSTKDFIRDKLYHILEPIAATAPITHPARTMEEIDAVIRSTNPNYAPVKDVLEHITHRMGLDTKSLSFVLQRPYKLGETDPDKLTAKLMAIAAVLKCRPEEFDQFLKLAQAEHEEVKLPSEAALRKPYEECKKLADDRYEHWKRTHPPRAKHSIQVTMGRWRKDKEEPSRS